MIKKYVGTGIDPYDKFYEYLQNIQFGTPFVEHVAKKTYIKTKADTIGSIENVDINEEYNNDDFEQIDKLYHQMKEEFEDDPLCGESFHEE